MPTIFLSHSSKDKHAIRQLADALKAKGYGVWLDEWELDVGDSIVELVQKGLKDSQFVAVWLTRNAITSGWVTKEWQTKVFAELSTKRIAVLPLLAEDCEVPLFLSEKKYADFRRSFEDGLNQLLRSLRRKTTQTTPDPISAGVSSISRTVENFLKDLEDAQIPFPTAGTLRLVPALKQIPRSGKLIRLGSMTPSLPMRSLYDHILSVGHSANVLFSELNPRLGERDLVELARVIAYHDLCETILGDLPQYTKLTPNRRRRARVVAEVRLSQLPNGVPERIANEFIAMFLQDSERLSLEAAQKIMEGTSEVRRYYYAMDKIDPIVATWRNIHLFRTRTGFSIDEYLSRMRHFFENPNVAKAVDKNVDDRRLLQLVHELQTASLARSYCEEPALLRRHRFALPAETVEALVEGRSILFTAPNRQAKRPTRTN